jgi:pyridoxine kinase
MTVAKALTFAGSDSSGGAGIQADLKTFQEYGVYGMTALTTIVAMKPESWSHLVFPVEIETLKAQLDTILNGVGVEAMKTGMLPTVETIELAAETIEKYAIRHVVIDPVMVCKGTDEVLNAEVAESLREVLVPKADVVTPNIFEATQLSKIKRIQTIDEMKEAARRIHELGAKHVVIKGGKLDDTPNAVDLLFDGSSFELLEAERVDTTFTHGAGCTFSAAITAELAQGRTVKEAVHGAKAFITAAISHGFRLNQFVGATYHAGQRVYSQVN